MARLEISGFEDVLDDFDMFVLTEDTSKEMLAAGADIAAKKQREYALSRLGKKGKGDGTTAKSITARVNKSGKTATIRFKGTRKNGTKRKRNAEIAFLNEFGVPGRGIPATKFIADANEDSADDVANAMNEVWIRRGK